MAMDSNFGQTRSICMAMTEQPESAPHNEMMNTHVDEYIRGIRS